MIKSIKEFLRIVNDKTPERIRKEMEKERESVKEYLRQYDPYLTHYCSVQHDRCSSCGLMVWEKDREHRYTAANDRHLEVFYQLRPEDRSKIIGRTDAELIEEWRLETGDENTFGEMCVSTDEHVKNRMMPFRFFEFGYRHGKSLLLDVFKAPIIIHGEFVGTRGNALNVSDRESDIYDLLQYYMSIGIAEKLGTGDRRDVAAYLIKDRRKSFNREFPG